MKSKEELQEIREMMEVLGIDKFINAVADIGHQIKKLAHAQEQIGENLKRVAQAMERRNNG